MPTDIESVRELVYDYYDSNVVTQENLSAEIQSALGVASTRTTFYVNEYKARAGKAIWNSTLCESVSSTNPFTPPFQVSFDTTVNVGVTSYSLTRGNFTIAPAPQASLFVDYYFQLFTDTDITEYLAGGLDWLNVGAQTIVGQPLPLIRAVHFYAAYLACQSLIRRTADLIDQAAGQVRANLDNIGKKYTALGAEMMKEATKTRDDYYKRSGQREAPVAGYKQLNQDVFLWTPRW